MNFPQVVPVFIYIDLITWQLKQFLESFQYLLIFRPQYDLQPKYFECLQSLASVSRVFFVVAVISVPEQVAERLEPSDDSSGPSYIDYSERRSLPISIPDYQTVEQGGEKFVVSVNGVVNVVRFVRLRV